MSTGVRQAPDPPPAAGPAAASADPASHAHRLARLARRLGTVLIVFGVGAVAWTIVVWQWQDPFTALYTLYEQHKLSGRYHRIAESYRPLLTQPREAANLRKAESPASRVAIERRIVASEAQQYRAGLHPGMPLGRIKVRRLGLNIILVAGTDHDSLTKGPGWDQRTYLPGQGELIYIAGHRTTYLAPFAHIDSLRPGDLVTIEVPYGTFTYRARSHVIVPADDLSRLRSFNRAPGTPAGEVVALQACHPRFFATHRYIVYAVLVDVAPKGGPAYAVRG